MTKVVVVLDKYSDWLETYSVLSNHIYTSVEVFFVDNDRNDTHSITTQFKELVKENTLLSFFPYSNKNDLFSYLKAHILNLKKGDLFVAPFIRYFDLWKLVSKVKNEVTTIHLSECFPDTFGHTGYRVGFRGRLLKSWITLPLAKWFAINNKPDLCYFPLADYFNNTFVKNTIKAKVPVLTKYKKQFFDENLGILKRPLIIGGFGYDVGKIAAKKKLDHYIATSKHKEIIIDGKVISLEHRICAEEVLLSGIVSEIYTYPSSVVFWAKRLTPELPIYCFATKKLDEQYGLFNLYAQKKLLKVGIKLYAEDKSMMCSFDKIKVKKKDLNAVYNS